MRTALTTFGVIFIAELPDKTALAALVLGTRYRTITVILGGWLAFLVQTLIAVLFGGILSALPERPIRIVAGAGFLVFAVLAWRRDEAEEVAGEEVAIDASRAAGRPGWINVFLVIFAAEWGDLTQLATAALTAQTREPVAVGVGALGALWLVTAIAAVAGTLLSRVLDARLLARVSAVVFAVVGVLVIASGVRG